ncbi:hypothetical protein PHYSODRAFT_393444, partial [Phytophthora sojae]
LRTPNPFPERSFGLYELRALTDPRYSPPRGEDVPLGPVISNPLDEAQSEHVAAQMDPMRSQRPELRPLLNPSAADYGVRPRDPAEACCLAFQQFLALHAIGPAVQVRARHADVPGGTWPGGIYDAQFESWAEHSRKLSSMEALRVSFSEVDVRIERKLRVDFAKVRAKRSVVAIAQSQTQFSAARFAPSSTPAAPSRERVSAVAQGQPRSNVADPAAPQLIAGKRGTAGVPALSPRGAGDQADQKRPRRLSNLGGWAPQTPMSSRREGTLAISPDTGFDPGTAPSPGGAPHGNADSHAHRAEPVEDASTRLATSDELHETQQQAGRLRDHVHDIDARLARCATGLDRLAERVEWLGVPRAVWDRLGTLEDDFAVLQGQLDLLARMQAPPAALPAPVAP